jgi:hypothetical protein
VSLGNVITIAVMVGGLFVFSMRIESRITALEVKLAALTESLEKHNRADTRPRR